jgi:hypothetical protein
MELLLFLEIRSVTVDLVLCVGENFQTKRVIAMKRMITVLTVVASILVAGAPQIRAQAPGTAPSSPAFVNGLSDSAFQGYIGDGGAAPQPAGATTASFAGYLSDKHMVGKGSVKQPRVAGGRIVSRIGSHAPQIKGHEPVGKVEQKGYGYAAPARSWFYDPWVGVEYMNVWLGERQLPALVTTSPPGVEGVFPGAEILFGGGVGGDSQAAGRLTVGAWLDCNRRTGVVGRFFATEGESIGFQESSNSAGSPLLARPFFETWDGAVGGTGPASFLVSGVRDLNDLEITLQGTISAHSETEVLGADAFVRHMIYRDRGRRLDLVAGYQFSRIDDSLRISSTTLATPPVFAARIDVEDSFEVTNKFHGGQLGLLGEMDRGALTLSLLGKVGLGNMNEVVTISGRSQITDLAGGVQNNTGGVLALPTNIGTYKKDRFAVLPELEAKATWHLTRHLDFSVGYTLMYWNNLALAGDQIETRNGLPVVNSSQWFGGMLDGPANPSLPEIVETDLFLHALNVGFAFRM